jgi:hypothetical protein
MQIWTIEELPAGAEPKIPPMRATFECAQFLRSASNHRQSGLFVTEIFLPNNGEDCHPTPELRVTASVWHGNGSHLHHSAAVD